MPLDTLSDNFELAHVLVCNRVFITVCFFHRAPECQLYATAGPQYIYKQQQDAL